MKTLVALGLVCIFSLGAFGQNIEKLIVKLPWKNMNVDSVLLVIHEQHNEVVFSYGNNLNVNMKVSFEKTKLTLAEILEAIAEQIECNYRVQKNKIILYPNGRKRTVFRLAKDIVNCA